MNGLAIICLIFYIIGGYLVFKNWGTSGDKDKYNFGGALFIIAMVLSVIIGVIDEFQSK